MICSLEGEGIDRAGTAVAMLVGLVDAYARRVYPAVLAHHDAESVSSPLGIWLLLAACVGAAGGEDRSQRARTSASRAPGMNTLSVCFGTIVRSCSRCL